MVLLSVVVVEGGSIANGGKQGEPSRGWNGNAAAAGGHTFTFSKTFLENTLRHGMAIPMPPEHSWTHFRILKNWFSYNF